MILLALAIKFRWYAEVFPKLKIHPINSDNSGNESQNTPYEKISNDVVLTWSQRKKYNERGYAETKLENKLRHVSIECVTKGVYKTKTEDRRPLVKRFVRRQLTRFRGSFLQNEDPLDFASIGVWQSVFVKKLAIHHNRSCFMTQSGLFFYWYTETFELFRRPKNEDP